MNYYIKNPKDKDKWLGVGSTHYQYYGHNEAARKKISLLLHDASLDTELVKLLSLFVNKFKHIVENKLLLFVGSGANRLDYGSSVSSSQLEQLVKNCAYAKEAMNDMKKFLAFCKKNPQKAEQFADHFYDKQHAYYNSDYNEYKKTKQIEKLISFIRQKVFFIDLPSISYSMPDEKSDWELVEDNPGARFVQKTCYAVFTGHDTSETGFLVNKLKLGGSISDALLFDSQLLAQRAGKKVSQKFSVIEVQVSIQGIKHIEGNYQSNALDGAMSIYEKDKIEKFFEQNDIEKLKQKLAEYEEKLKAQEPQTVEKVVRRKI